MPRGKSPELTVRRILDASLRLFVGQGYEKTSIQDITESLGDLTKGAIYHHFKSKEDILIAVVNRMFDTQDTERERIARDPAMTGAEKLAALFLLSVSDPRQLQFFQTAPRLLDNPSFLAQELRRIVEEVAPRYVEPIVRQGIADGSIRTAYPKQLTEMMLLLTNLFMTPLVFYADWEELRQRLQCFDELFAPSGVSLYSAAMDDRLHELSLAYMEKK